MATKSQATTVVYNFAQNSLSKTAEAGVELKIVLPNGVDTGAVITVRGEQAPSVKAYGRKLYQEYNMKRQAAIARKREPEELTLEEAEALAVEAAVVRTIGWSGVGNDDGAIPFSPEAARKFYQENSWIQELVTEESKNSFRFC